MKLDSYIDLADSKNKMDINANGYSPPNWTPDEFLEHNAVVIGGYTNNGLHHIFGLSKDDRHDAVAWNSSSLWKQWAGLGDDDWVFCENIVGSQYFFRKNYSCVFEYNINTGLIEELARSYREFFTENIKNVFNLNEPFSKLLREQSIFESLSHLSPEAHPMMCGVYDDWQWVNSMSSICFSSQLCYKLSKIPTGTVITSINHDPETNTVELVFGETSHKADSSKSKGKIGSMLSLLLGRSDIPKSKDTPKNTTP